MKKFLCLMAVVMITTFSVIGCTSKKSESKSKGNGTKVTMVTSVGGVTDVSLADRLLLIMFR
ncbi:MAG: hypothetical protein RSD36_17835 [Terrisporobacter sp.]